MAPWTTRGGVSKPVVKLSSATSDLWVTSSGGYGVLVLSVTGIELPPGIDGDQSGTFFGRPRSLGLADADASAAAASIAVDTEAESRLAADQEVDVLPATAVS